MQDNSSKLLIKQITKQNKTKKIIGKSVINIYSI